MKSKRKFLILGLAMILIFSVGCSSEDADNSTEITESEENNVKEKEIGETAKEAYQRILEEYTVKMKEATPILIEEYKTESKNNARGLERLAELSNEKIVDLAEMNNNGVKEMADIMLKKGSGSYDEYEDWTEKLMGVYMDEADKIMDVYMKSAM